MKHTYNAYNGEVLHTGPGFSAGNFSDQDITSALNRMVRWPEFMPGFLRHHRLTPAQVVIAANTTNGDNKGAEAVHLFVALYPQLLGEWYAANPLESGDAAT